MPTVSVVLPVYNGEKYVGNAIHSIIEQTYKDWELIIVDDGSSDHSLSICETISKTDPRIRVYKNQENLGLARTMNRLVDFARGEYIAVQEQDDISLPWRIAEEVNLLNENEKVGLVSGIADWLDDEGMPFAKFPGILAYGGSYPVGHDEMIRYLYIEQCKVVNAACMFRRSILQKIPGPFDKDAKISIDWQFFLHIAHCAQIEGIPKVFVKMRRGKAHQSITKNKELQFREARRCISIIYNHYHLDANSPINYLLFRKAMANELNLEGRFYGGLKGLSLILSSLIYYPFHKQPWISLFQLISRGIHKALPSQGRKYLC